MEKLIFLFIVLLFSCNGHDRGVRIITYYPTGELQSEYYVDKDGHANGEFKYYFKNGALESVENYTIDKLNGWSILYDSLGGFKAKEEYVLIYPDMFNVNANKFIESDSASIEKKESYMNNRLFYKSNILVRDSSYFSKLEMPDIIKLGDTLFFDFYIVIPFFKSSNKTGRTISSHIRFMSRILNSEFSSIKTLSGNKFGFRYRIPYWIKGSFVPKLKGEGVLAGVVVEIDENGEYFEHYFKKSYKVE